MTWNCRHLVSMLRDERAQRSKPWVGQRRDTAGDCHRTSGEGLFVLPDANQQHAGRLTLAADGSHQLHNYKSTSYASSLLVFSSLLATRRLEALPPRTNTLLIRPSPSPGLHQARSASLPEEGEREMAMRDSCGDAKGHVKRTRATWETRHLNTIHPLSYPNPPSSAFQSEGGKGGGLPTRSGHLDPAPFDAWPLWAVVRLRSAAPAAWHILIPQQGERLVHAPPAPLRRHCACRGQCQMSATFSRGRTRWQRLRRPVVRLPIALRRAFGLSVRPCPVEMVLLSKDSLDEIPTGW